MYIDRMDINEEDILKKVGANSNLFSVYSTLLSTNDTNIL